MLANEAKKLNLPKKIAPIYDVRLQLSDGYGEKIINAVTKSAQRMLIKFSKEEEQRICDFVEKEIKVLGKNRIDILEIHNIVESALDNVNPKVAQSYRN